MKKKKKIKKNKTRTLTFKKFFASLKLAPALFENISSFVCLVFKVENKSILRFQF